VIAVASALFTGCAVPKRRPANALCQEGSPEIREAYASDIDMDEYPEPINALFSGDHLEAVKTILKFRETDTREVLSEEEQSSSLFDYFVAYRASTKNGKKASHVFVRMGPKPTEFFSSPHRDGDRREAAYLVSMEEWRVVCWNFSYFPLEPVGEGQSCPVVFDIAEPHPLGCGPLRPVSSRHDRGD